MGSPKKIQERAPPYDEFAIGLLRVINRDARYADASEHNDSPKDRNRSYGDRPRACQQGIEMPDELLHLMLPHRC